MTNDYGGGFSEPLATRLQITKPLSLDFSGDLISGVCHPLIIQPVDNNNQPASLMSSIDINLSTTGGGTFYDSSDCSGGPVAQIMDFYGNLQVVSYSQSTGATPLNLTAADSSAGLSSGTLTFNLVAVGRYVSGVFAVFPANSTLKNAIGLI